MEIQIQFQKDFDIIAHCVGWMNLNHMETKRICTSKVFCKSWTPAYKKFVPKHSGLSNSDLEQIEEKT